MGAAETRLDVDTFEMPGIVLNMAPKRYKRNPNVAFRALPNGLRACSPDQFLSEVLREAPGALLTVLDRQAASYRRPELTVRELITQLAKVAPRFADRALALIDQPPSFPPPC
jgi:hypothetical protein